MDWAPFDDRIQFETADLLFRKVQMSAPTLDALFELWGASMDSLDGETTGHGLFQNNCDLYDAIDAARVGDVPWKCMKVKLSNIGANAPSWKRKEYDLWYRDSWAVMESLLDNPDFDKEFDYVPYVELDDDDQRVLGDFFSANFAWRHSNEIYTADKSTKGAMYCPVISGSDKPTVSVATGHVEYHPLYLSIGNPHNNVRRAHRGAVAIGAFFAIPKADRKYDKDTDFRVFKKKLFHMSMSAIFQPLKESMTTLTVLRCPDGHYRRVIFDLGPFIADYPEQVLMAGIVQNWCARCPAPFDDLDGPFSSDTRSWDHVETMKQNFDSKTLWDDYGIDDDIIFSFSLNNLYPFTAGFPRADIYELLSPDLLHQLIKGTFKDHLVAWVEDYLIIEHGQKEAERIMDDIDHRIAAVPSFAGLRRFPNGRRFKQWTGDDSKALMKVYLPALVGYLPSGILKTFSSFLDFYYTVRKPHFNEDDLAAVQETITEFHTHREIFRVAGVRPTRFSLPRQHSITHYPNFIPEFGAPTGLCSSITESRHITAVKKPWRRSNRFEALGQMLVMNQRLDKMVALRADFVERGMLPISHVVPVDDDDDDGGAVDDRIEASTVLARRNASRYPGSFAALAAHIHHPQLPELARRFLYDQLHPDRHISGADVALEGLPMITSHITVYHSAVSTFFAPNDPSGIHGMRSERIRATPSWRKEGPRYDCAYVVDDKTKEGFRGMSVVRIHLFFSFKHNHVRYPCALIEWFKKRGARPDADVGMWIVDYESKGRVGSHVFTVIHLDTIFRAVHLVPVFGTRSIPLEFSFTYSLDCFDAFYVNRFVDSHAYDMIF
ncbi:hypothetical protein C8J56DRAFT_999638 [Mycena floridula]|nr:hypothetical protein C8J56DRAFT_999638 [Mycena floridula]